MAKCTQAWTDCHGLFGCIGAAFEVAAKCTASALEDNYTNAVNQERKLCYESLECAWKAYLAGGVTADEYLHACWLRIGGANVWQSPEVRKLFPDKMLFGSKPTKAMESIHQQALHACGQKAPEAAWLTAIVVNTPGISQLAYSENDFQMKLKYSQGLCAKYSGNDVLNAAKGVIKTYFDTVAKMASGDVEAAYKAMKALASGSASGVVMESLFSLISDQPPDGLGIEIPDSVKTFLTCLFNKAGAKLIEAVKTALIDGDPETAAKSLAPYAIDCGAKTLKDELGDGSPFRPLVSALAVAVEAYLAPEPAAPSKTPAKVPVGSACPEGTWAVVAGGPCYPSSVWLGVAGMKANLKETLTTQQEVLDAVAKQKALDAAAAAKAKSDQRQMLLLAGAAVVAYFVLNK